MDENASRAVFIGVSVLVAIITITVVLNFYRTAKNSASVANRYDITTTDNAYLNRVLEKEKITGAELRYLLNYYYENKNVNINIENQILYKVGNELENAELIGTNINTEETWLSNYERYIDYNIRLNYNYRLSVQETEYKTTITATFQY